MAENNSGGRITAQELQFASWWVRNRQTVRRTGIGTLIGLVSLVWGYALWSLLDAYAISYPRESRITRDIAINQQLLAALEQDRPQDVDVSAVQLFQTTDGRMDMAVDMSNPNEQWWVEFNYQYNVSGELTPMRSGYVLPMGTQVLSELGYKPKTKGSRSATLLIDNVRWHRTDPSIVGEKYETFASKRLDLAFDNVKYDTDITLGTKKIGQSSFTLINKSGYGFWNVDLVVRLYRGTTPVAMNRIQVRQVLPGESRPIQIVWLDNIASVTKTEIIPQVNLLDPSAYLPTEYFK